MSEALIRVYADTSVYGGVFNDEFSRASQAFFQQVKEQRLRLAVSEVVKQELLLAPQQVRDFYADIEPLSELIELSAEAFALRDAYLGAGIVSKKSMDDALHVALAAVSQCPILVSWNCKHIVHFDKIPLYNAVNGKRGYSPLAIHTPLEVISYESND